MAKFVSVEPFHPGEYIQDEITARNWTHDDFAEVSGISRRQILNLIQGKSAITPESAQKIGEAFGQEPRTWIDLQISCEMAIAAKGDREIARKAKLYAKVPVREMRKRGWITQSTNVEEIESSVCAFLGIANVDEQPRLSVAARKVTDYTFTSPGQMAWYHRVRQLGESVMAAVYRESHFDSGVDALLTLAAQPEDISRVPEALAEMGIRLVVVEHLAKTKIDGVALWLDDASPVVGLSMRYDRIDNLWFNLLHELIHVKYKDASPVDEDLLEGQGGDLPEIELRANQEASNKLINNEKLESFIARQASLYYERRVVEFSQARNVHPGIVVGQLQGRQELKYFQLRKYLVKVRDQLFGQCLTDGWGTALDLEED